MGTSGAGESTSVNIKRIRVTQPPSAYSPSYLITPTAYISFLAQVLHNPVVCTSWPSSNSTARRSRGTCANRQQRHSNTTISYSMDLDAERNVLHTKRSRPAEVATTTQQSVPSHLVGFRSARFKCEHCEASFGHTKSLYQHQRTKVGIDPCGCYSRLSLTA